MNLQIQEAQQTKNMINTKKTTVRHIMVKSVEKQRNKEKEKRLIDRSQSKMKHYLQENKKKKQNSKKWNDMLKAQK